VFMPCVPFNGYCLDLFFLQDIKTMVVADTKKEGCDRFGRVKTIKGKIKLDKDLLAGVFRTGSDHPVAITHDPVAVKIDNLFKGILIASAGAFDQVGLIRYRFRRIS